MWVCVSMLLFGHVADVWATYPSTHLGYCVRQLPLSVLALSLSFAFCFVLFSSVSVFLRRF